MPDRHSLRLEGNEDRYDLLIEKPADHEWLLRTALVKGSKAMVSPRYHRRNVPDNGGGEVRSSSLFSRVSVPAW